MTDESSTPEINIRLSADEALVLFELLSRGDDSPDRSYRVEHSSEQVVLWRLQGILAKALGEPFDPAYRELVDAARGRLSTDLVE